MSVSRKIQRKGLGLDVKADVNKIRVRIEELHHKLPHELVCKGRYKNVENSPTGPDHHYDDDD